VSVPDYVLVVDDEPSTLLIIESSIQSICNVVSTSTPAKAVDLAEMYSPALIILDIDMPETDGFELCRRLSALPETCDSGIIFVTSHTSVEMESKALSLGAIDFIPKPINQKVCRLRVSNHLRLYSQTRALKTAHEALYSEKTRLSVTLESIGDAVISTDKNGLIKFMNRTAQRLTEWRETEAIGQPICKVMALKDALSGKALFNPLDIALSQERIVGMPLNAQLVGKQGGLYRVEDSAAPIFSEKGELEGGVIVFQDVTEAIAMATEMSHLTNHDQLTGLPNRVLLHDRMSQAVASAQASGKKVAVLLIDIDNFKYLNDLLGHQIGDAVIKHVARQIETVSGSAPTLSRIGGDEFVLLLDEVQSIAAANRMAHSVLSTSKIPFLSDNEEHFFSLSIGISVYPYDASSPDELMRHADTAMYKVKSQGKNNFAFYSEELYDQMKGRVKLEKLLHQSLKEESLVVHYQPKVCMESREVLGAEALVRLMDDTGNIVPPNDFIPIAEEVGLISKLGQQVLKKACRQAKSWLEQGTPLKVAVNIAAQQFNDSNFIGSVRQTVDDLQLPVEFLELEVTESALISSFEVAQNTINTLKDLGISVALDDFGTGYSSLSYLRAFNLDVLKIDRSFVKDAITDTQAQSIVKAIINLAEMLGLQLVCEGIETDLHFELMKELGCHEAQGFLFSRPLSADDFNRYMLNNKKTCTVVPIPTNRYTK